MTQRSRLDAFLINEAREAGADVREGATWSGEAADVVVVADGANGSTARRLGLGGGIRHGVAYEGEIAYAHLQREFPQGTALIDVGDVPGGYAWIFPKGDHLNVGVGAWGVEGPRIKLHWAAFCSRHGLDPALARTSKGYRLPMRTSATALASESALAVGDAAGLIDPISGDGIYECFVSSQIAADSVAALLSGHSSSLDGYAKAIEHHLAALHLSGMFAKRAFDAWPTLTYRVASSTFTWGTIERLLTGELRSVEEAGSIRRMPFRLMQLVARGA